MVLAVPYHLRKLGGRCISINVLKMDRWRVKNVFKSNNGVSYEAISSYMYRLEGHPSMTDSISFEQYPSTKKFLLCDEVEILRISKFTVGEPYCVILVKRLKLLNKFLGMTINNSKVEFCKEDDSHNANFLFSIDKEYYHTDL